MARKKKERREQKRAHIELDIDLSTYGKYYLSKLENVSIGGAFVRTRDLHPIGTQVKLRFALPNTDEAIETDGSVVWVYDQAGKKEPNSSGMGIEFGDISEKDRERIAQFIIDYNKD